MKKADETANEANGSRKKVSKKAFKNFAEYWHFVKNLPEYQRKLLVNSMSGPQQRSLKASYDRGGWEDLFMRNACDETLDEIKKQTDVDLLSVRMKVLAGKPQLMHKQFWQYVNDYFDRVPWEHISYIFDGITIEEHDEPDYVKLVRYVSDD